MNHVLQMRPIALAVCAALATAAHAQVFDPNSAAVRQAYVGVATQEKKDVALAGLTQLVNQIQGTCAFCGSGGVTDVFITTPIGPPIIFIPFVPINSTIQAASDGDLGTPGAAVTLNNTLLQSLASFSTARDFSIGTGGAKIDTNGFNLSLTGTLTAKVHSLRTVWVRSR